LSSPDEFVETENGVYDYQLENDKATEVKVDLTDINKLVVEENASVFQVRTPNGIYRLPIGQVNFNSLVLNLRSDLEKIRVRIGINKTEEGLAEAIRKTVSETGARVLSEPTTVQAEFYSDDGNTGDLSLGNIYATVILPLNDGADPIVATGVIYNAETNSFSHVPTIFDEVDGEPVAIIKAQAKGIYMILETPKSFDDISTHWAKKDIEQLASKLIINGKNGSVFDPDGDVTRAEFVAMMVRALGISEIRGRQSFMDVPARAWYAKELGVAVTSGLVSGYEDGSFRPNAKITRAEMAAILDRAMKYAKYNVKSGVKDTSFNDESNIPNWAKGSVQLMTNEGIIKGYDDGTFKPNKNATRGETAAMIARMLRIMEFIE